jgi:hypothetical protein
VTLASSGGSAGRRNENRPRRPAVVPVRSGRPDGQQQQGDEHEGLK